jgi:hypothetical protein
MLPATRTGGYSPVVPEPHIKCVVTASQTTEFNLTTGNRSLPGRIICRYRGTHARSRGDIPRQAHIGTAAPAAASIRQNVPCQGAPSWVVKCSSKTNSWGRSPQFLEEGILSNSRASTEFVRKLLAAQPVSCAARNEGLVWRRRPDCRASNLESCSSHV